ALLTAANLVIVSLPAIAAGSGLDGNNWRHLLCPFPGADVSPAGGWDRRGATGRIPMAVATSW
ncbi:MAG TPA: hypothetical protein VFQ77_22210, partial [Pseudonocardiaceae bacterium]|nr:hypothetical protein [Pseudonocardiaceae bacterium]